MLLPKPKMAFIVSRFNQEITDQLYQGAIQRLEQQGIVEGEYQTFHVPGAVEIPVVAKQLAQRQKYEVIIALGAVIRGDTSHYDYVCSQVSDGCQRVALDYGIPVIFGILTTEDETQAYDRLGGAHGHKGAESVDAALEMVQVIRDIHARCS
jgi:6,7-dimethyl-8-ribityllumazine synthase